MNYLSTSEAAVKWQISSRRVAKLAEQGRIDGAIIVGNNWLIPATAAKPADARKKKSDDTEQGSFDKRYRFPHIIYCVRSEEQLESEFDDEEKLLWSGAHKYEAGEIEVAISLLEKLLAKTERQYIRLGALHYLFFAYRDSRQFDNAIQALNNFRLEIAEVENHVDELNILALDVNSFLDGTGALIDAANNFSIADASSSCLPYLLAVQAFSDAYNVGRISAINKIVSNETACRLLEHDGYYYAAMQMHVFTSMICMYYGKEAASSEHLLRAVDIALKCDYLSTLCFQLSYITNLRDLLKDKYPAETINKLIAISDSSQKSYSDFFSYYGKTNFITKLQGNDYQLISYLVRGITTDEIAKLEGMTIYAVRKEFNRIYKIFNASSKKEFLENCTKELLNMT